MSKEAMKLALDLATIHHTDDEYPELRQKVRRLAKEALAEQPAQQEPVAVRLWDSQWVNVVNHDNCYRDWSKEDAINHAVKMTEKYIAGNVASNKLPPAQKEPVATLWQHGETGRTRITMPDDITDCDARWFKAADLYTSPPQRTWVGLTDEEIGDADTWLVDQPFWRVVAFARAIEAALRSKNT